MSAKFIPPVDLKLEARKKAMVDRIRGLVEEKCEGNVTVEKKEELIASIAAIILPTLGPSGQTKGAVAMTEAASLGTNRPTNL